MGGRVGSARVAQPTPFYMVLEKETMIMTISRQVCPFHADEDIRGVPAGSIDGSLSFTCTRTGGHPQGGPHSWLHVPQPDVGATLRMAPRSCACKRERAIDT